MLNGTSQPLCRAQKPAQWCDWRSRPCRWHDPVGDRLWLEWCGCRRDLFQHRDDRLSGNPDRPELCGPDHHLHLSAHRQCRRESRGYGAREARRDRLRHARTADAAEQLPQRADAARMDGGAGADRACRHRHARADPPYPRRRCADRCCRASSRGQVRHRQAADAGAGLAGTGGHGPRQDRDARAAG